MLGRICLELLPRLGVLSSRTVFGFMVMEGKKALFSGLFGVTNWRYF